MTLVHSVDADWIADFLGSPRANGGFDSRLAQARSSARTVGSKRRVFFLIVLFSPPFPFSVHLLTTPWGSRLAARRFRARSRTAKAVPRSPAASLMDGSSCQSRAWATRPAAWSRQSDSGLRKAGPPMIRSKGTFRVPHPSSQALYRVGTGL